jgi:hypothetical protein
MFHTLRHLLAAACLYAATKALVTTEPKDTIICAIILADYSSVSNLIHLFISLLPCFFSYRREGEIIFFFTWEKLKLQALPGPTHFLFKPINFSNF